MPHPHQTLDDHLKRARRTAEERDEPLEASVLREEQGISDNSAILVKEVREKIHDLLRAQEYQPIKDPGIEKSEYQYIDHIQNLRGKQWYHKPDSPVDFHMSDEISHVTGMWESMQGMEDYSTHQEHQKEMYNTEIVLHPGKQARGERNRWDNIILLNEIEKLTDIFRENNIGFCLPKARREGNLNPVYHPVEDAP